MKKRIGVIMYETSRSKGQELVAQRMVKYFRALGNEAYLITSVYHDGKEAISEEQIGEKGYFLINDVELNIPVIRVASLISKWPPRRIGFKDIVQALENIVNDFQLNVLITHSTLWNGPEEVAKFVEWRRNIKALGGYPAALVFCHMSHYQEPSPKRYSVVERSFRMAWNRLSLRTILRVANLILVVSPYEEEAKIKMGAPRDRIFLFPGGIDDVSFSQFSSADPSEFRHHLGSQPNSKIVAFVGTLEVRKNAGAVLDVAEKLTERGDIQFVVAGSGDSEYTEIVKKKADGLSNAKYLGELSEKEKFQLMQNSFLNIILSKMEALGLTQLEFMFEGVPVVTSGVGGQSWIVRDGEEGIHVKGPDDIEGAVNAIVALADDAGRWKKLSSNAKERASQYRLTNLMQHLDNAITKEVEKETGLSTLPDEVRSTISQPEYVIHTWSHGTTKIAATESRVFIQRGRLSRNTLEIPYSSIKSIEHVRRHHWKSLVVGGLLSLLLFVQHYVSPIISRHLTTRLQFLLSGLIPTSINLEAVIRLLWVIPIALAAIVFIIGMRKGYALHGASMNPVFLSPAFGKSVQYIREIQDREIAGNRTTVLDETNAAEE
ncbi:MAG TPA: glycosyltransferase [Candidatus Dormibacteraeota bacterium]|nr:glycosyltransferase [Candidatus Dormibacteraeota bacterium]